MIQNIGIKIKNLRESANISVEEFVERANITISQLELIENQTVNPSMSIMSRIARVLGIRLGTLLDGSELLGPVISRKLDVKESIRISESESVSTSNLNFFSLAEGKKDRHMEPFIIDVASCDDSKSLSHHEGEEFIYILEGEITLEYADKKYILTKGDSVYYDSIIPHHVSADKSTTAKVLAVIYTPL